MKRVLFNVALLLLGFAFPFIMPTMAGLGIGMGLALFAYALIWAPLIDPNF